MFLIFEGFDKTGKTTVKKKLGELNKWEQIFMDRGPVGYMFYDEIWERKTAKRDIEYKRDLDQIVRFVDYTVIFLWSTPKDIIKRHTYKGERCEYGYEYIDELQDRYQEMCKMYLQGGNVYVIDTSENDITETMRKVGEIIEKEKEVLEWKRMNRVSVKGEFDGFTQT